jgi:protein TonB
MAHAIGLRATSLVASATLLGAAVLAALTMSIVQRVVETQEGAPFVTIIEPPAPKVEPVRVRPVEPPRSPVEGETTAPVDQPPPPMPQFAAEPAPPRFYPAPTIVNPQWVRQPRDLARYYPERALRREIEGRVVLDCGVSVRGVLNCVVVSETPANWGFGEPAMRDGVAVEARHRMVVPFEIR